MSILNLIIFLYIIPIVINVILVRLQNKYNTTLNTNDEEQRRYAILMIIIPIVSIITIFIQLFVLINHPFNSDKTVIKKLFGEKTK